MRYHNGVEAFVQTETVVSYHLPRRVEFNGRGSDSETGSEFDNRWRIIFPNGMFLGLPHSWLPSYVYYEMEEKVREEQGESVIEFCEWINSIKSYENLLTLTE